MTYYFGLYHVEIWLQRSCLHREQRLKKRLPLISTFIFFSPKLPFGPEQWASGRLDAHDPNAPTKVSVRARNWPLREIHLHLGGWRPRGETEWHKSIRHGIRHMDHSPRRTPQHQYWLDFQCQRDGGRSLALLKKQRQQTAIPFQNRDRNRGGAGHTTDWNIGR